MMAKKVLNIATHIYERLYQRLTSKEAEQEGLARTREKKTRDLANKRCIKDDDGRVLAKGVKIRKRCRSYFSKLLMAR